MSGHYKFVLIFIYFLLHFGEIQTLFRWGTAVNTSSFTWAAMVWWIQHRVEKYNKSFDLSFALFQSQCVVCSMGTLHWCWFSKPRSAPVSLSATYTTFSSSYSPFAPYTNLDESTFPWCLYRWELLLLSRCPKQQESWLLSFEIFWVGSLNSPSTYIFCSSLFAVSSRPKAHF